MSNWTQKIRDTATGESFGLWYSQTKARMAAPVWRALTTAGESAWPSNVSVVSVRDDSETVYVLTEANWKRVVELLNDLDRENAELKERAE